MARLRSALGEIPVLGLSGCHANVGVMIALRPWSNDDLPVLEKTVGNPVMARHLGSIEDPGQIAARHERYLDTSQKGGMFTIALGPDSIIVGSIGFWERTWQGERIYEAGWMVLPEYAGRGIATKAALAIVHRARVSSEHRFLHAFSSVCNVASNIVCERAGFANLGKCKFEYPKGHFMQCNDWRIDLGTEIAI